MSSTDKKVTTELIETLEDGRKGYTAAADKLADSDRPDLSSTMREMAAQRAAFSSELETMAAAYGDDIDESGSILGTMHRGWMAVKDAIAGSDPDGVLDAASRGESHAVDQYTLALHKDISPKLRSVIERQLVEIRKASSQITTLKQAA